MATHSSILAWRIPWTEEPGRLQCIQSVRHDWETNTFTWVLNLESEVWMWAWIFLILPWEPYPLHTWALLAHLFDAGSLVLLDKEFVRESDYMTKGNLFCKSNISISIIVVSTVQRESIFIILISSSTIPWKKLIHLIGNYVYILHSCFQAVCNSLYCQAILADL